MITNTSLQYQTVEKNNTGSLAHSCYKWQLPFSPFLFIYLFVKSSCSYFVFHKYNTMRMSNKRIQIFYELLPSFRRISHGSAFVLYDTIRSHAIQVLWWQGIQFCFSVEDMSFIPITKRAKGFSLWSWWAMKFQWCGWVLVHSASNDRRPSCGHDCKCIPIAWKNK